MVWHCFARPTIVLPKSLLETLSPDDTRQVLAHEICHIKRRDYLCRYFEMIVLAVYWWNPIAWLARTRLQRAEEACCDASVLAVLDEGAKSYTRAIYRAIHWMADCRETLPAGASGFGYADSLRHRFRNILTMNGRNVMSLRLHWCCVLLAVVVLVAAGKVRLVAQDVAESAELAVAESVAVEGFEIAVAESVAEEAAPAVTVSGFALFSSDEAVEVSEATDEASPFQPGERQLRRTFRENERPSRNEFVEARLDRLEEQINALVKAMQRQSKNRRGSEDVLIWQEEGGSDIEPRRSRVTAIARPDRPVVTVKPHPPRTARVHVAPSAPMATKATNLARRVEEQQMLIKTLQRENELLRDKLESVIKELKASRN